MLFLDDGASVCSSVTEDNTRALREQDSLLHKAQLLELQERLVKARNEGQELGELKQNEEVKTLQSELGAKSKCVHEIMFYTFSCQCILTHIFSF